MSEPNGHGDRRESTSPSTLRRLGEWKTGISLTGLGAIFVGFMGITTDDWRGKVFWPWIRDRADWLLPHPWTVLLVLLLAISIAALRVTWSQGRTLQAKLNGLEEQLTQSRSDAQNLEDQLRTEIDDERSKAEHQEAELRNELSELREQSDSVKARLTDQVLELSDALASQARSGDSARVLGFGGQAERDLLVSSVLAGAQRSIVVVGVVNEIVARLDEGFLTQFFQNGGTLRALFIDPDGQEVHIRQELEVQFQAQRVNRPPDGEFANRTRAAIERLRPYHVANLAAHQYQAGRTGKLAVRVYDRQPSLSLLLVDDKWALFHYYGLSAMGYQTPHFEIDARAQEDPQPILQYYAAEFETLWEMVGSRDWEWQS